MVDEVADVLCAVCCVLCAVCCVLDPASITCTLLLYYYYYLLLYRVLLTIPEEARWG